MKYCCIGLILLLSMLAFCIFSTAFICTYTQETTAYLEKGFQLAEQENFQDATKQIEEAFHTWYSHHGFFGIVLRHAESDEVNSYFQSVLQYAKNENSEEFFGACAQLMASIEHVANMELPHYYNIF